MSLLKQYYFCSKHSIEYESSILFRCMSFSERWRACNNRGSILSRIMMLYPNE